MKCAFISFLPHPVYNTSVVENMRRNQQGGPVFKSTQNGRINMLLKILTVHKFKRNIHMRNQKQNFIGCKGTLLGEIQDLQDPTATCQSRIQDPQDPTKYVLSEIQDPQDLTAILP